MEPNDIAVHSPEEEEKMARMVKSEQLMRSLRDKLPNESKLLGIEGVPKSYFLVLKTPITKDSQETAISGEKILIKTHEHLIVTQSGIRVLVFKDFPGHNPDISEDIFQKGLAHNSLQDPMTHNPESNSPISPYYTPDDDNERITLFNSYGVSVTVQLEKDVYQYVSLRNIRNGEFQSFIERDQSNVKKDIESIDEALKTLEET